jgi:hypothetical protein
MPFAARDQIATVNAFRAPLCKRMMIRTNSVPCIIKKSTTNNHVNIMKTNATTSRKNNDDTCRCMCYPNGGITVLLAQLLLLGGFILSADVMLGCDFVTADIHHHDGTDSTALIDDQKSPSSSFLSFSGESNATTTRRGFGFFNQQDANDLCHFQQMGSGYQYSVKNTDYFVDYVDWLGPDWVLPRKLGLAALFSSVLIWIWLLLFSCVAHPRPLRLLLSSLILLVMPLQFGTLAILKSDFCQERHCTIGFTAKMNLAAGLVFLVSGLLICCTKNYSATRSEQHDDEETVCVEDSGCGTGTTSTVLISPVARDGGSQQNNAFPGASLVEEASLYQRGH